MKRCRGAEDVDAETCWVNDPLDYRTDETPHALAILFGVVGVVAIPLAVPGNGLASPTGVEQFTMLAGA